MGNGTLSPRKKLQCTRLVWVPKNDLRSFLLLKETDRIVDLLVGKEEKAFTGQGRIVNSGRI